MQNLKAFLQQHWLNMLAVILFLIPVGRYLWAARWLDLLALPFMAFIGLISFLASEEMSDVISATHYFNLSLDQSFHSPILVKIGGAVMLLAAVFATFVT